MSLHKHQLYLLE